MVDDLPRREFRSRDELRTWLQQNGRSESSFWLVTYKKHVPEYYLRYGEVVEELLCFGWVDGRSRRVDDDRTSLLVAPRKAGSTWSAPNKERVARLTEQGLMTAAGQRKIDDAREDGSWSYLDDIDRLIVPDDLGEALNRNAKARRNFDGFNDSAKKIILLWIKTAKREATRSKRISETVRLAAKNVKAAHPEAKGV